MSLPAYVGVVGGSAARREEEAAAEAEANRWVDIAIPTGLGELRNGLIVRAADVLIAVGGEFGTLSEIALALRGGTPVVGLGTWNLERRGAGTEGILTAANPAAAVERAFSLILF